MNDIQNVVAGEPLFETHCHQLGFDAHQWDTKTHEELLGYAHADVEVATAALPAEARTLFDAWPFVRTTGYGAAVQLAAQSLFNLDFTAENASSITAALRAFCHGKSSAQIHAELYAHANIAWSVNDMFWLQPGDASRFSGAAYLPFVSFAPRFEQPGTHHYIGATAESVTAFSQAANVSIHSLAELERALDDYATRLVATRRVVAFKTAVAYGRRLGFDRTDAAVAARLFDQMLRGTPDQSLALSDYLFHRLVERARTFNLPLQIHTGYLAGTWQDLRHGDPHTLVPVFQHYRDVRFDLFHAGWPWTSFMGALGKAFPNVWLDLCWAWAMNPLQAERALDEWLAAVPSNKIFLFGADIQSPFAVIGYALQARHGLASVLQRKITRGEYDTTTAQFVARRLLHENARAFFTMH